MSIKHANKDSQMKQITRLTTLALFSLLSATSLVQAVEIKAPYVRATLPGAPNSAAFMTILNDSDQAVSILQASSPATEYCELHTHIHDDGVMRMRQVDKIEIPANGSVELKPGGLHLMFFNAQPLQEGQQVEITLTLSDGSQQTLTAPVKNLLKQGHKMHHHMGEH